LELVAVRLRRVKTCRIKLVCYGYSAAGCELWVASGRCSVSTNAYRNSSSRSWRLCGSAFRADYGQPSAGRLPNREPSSRVARLAASLRGSCRDWFSKPDSFGESSFWQINQNDIRVLPQAVEHDLLTVRRDVESSHRGGIVKMGERASLLRGQVEQPKILRRAPSLHID